MSESTHRLNSTSSDANFKLSCETVLSKLIPKDQSVIDAILACNHVDKPEIHLPDGQKFIWYLAIGSMINPISLYLRDLIPILSYPATCLDHELLFRGHVGMADIEPSPQAQFHGVVHLLSEEHMLSLDQLESMYQRIPVTCLNYHGQSQVVYAYKMMLKNQPLHPPQERYLDIIVKGCEYYKVRPDYIKKLREEQPVVPRRRPESFQSFTHVPADVFITQEELQKHDGNDSSLPIWISINGKVLEYSGMPPSDHPDFLAQKSMQAFVRQKMAGREVTKTMAKALYEPMYKIPVDDEDICDQHRAQMEDQYCQMLRNQSNVTYWKPIGRLRLTTNST